MIFFIKDEEKGSIPASSQHYYTPSPHSQFHTHIHLHGCMHWMKRKMVQFHPRISAKSVTPCMYIHREVKVFSLICYCPFYAVKNIQMQKASRPSLHILVRGNLNISTISITCRSTTLKHLDHSHHPVLVKQRRTRRRRR